MKKLLIVLTFLIPSISWAYTAESVYLRLAAANPNVKPLHIVFKQDAYIWCSLACTDGSTITVTPELLDLVANEDELAAVIGHEMAHTVLTDESEMDADILGLKFAEKAGYDKCVAAQLMKKYAGDSVHPSGEIRYKNTGCP